MSEPSLLDYLLSIPTPVPERDTFDHLRSLTTDLPARPGTRRSTIYR
jgi:hypothetical protein